MQEAAIINATLTEGGTIDSTFTPASIIDATLIAGGSGGGPPGAPGPAGLGVPAGGNTNQLLAKVSGTDNDTHWKNIVESDVTNLVSDLALKAPLDSPTFTGTLTSGGPAVFNDTVTVPSPVNATDAADKDYVDGLASGVSIKAAVNYATIEALPANTYDNGTSGVGATLTGDSTGVLSVDGSNVALNDRILVKNESTAANNGIYVCTTEGAVGTAYILTRASDLDTDSDIAGSFAFVENGATNISAGFVVIGSGPFTIGTTDINWTQFSGAGTLAAGLGITIAGNVVSANDATTISKGILELSNDLGGTASAPTTPTAVHITGNETINGEKTFVNTMHSRYILPNADVTYNLGEIDLFWDHIFGRTIYLNPTASLIGTIDGEIGIMDGANITLGEVTGTSIGTGIHQKLGFYNNTPIEQPTGDVATALSDLGLIESPTIAIPDATFTVSGKVKQIVYNVLDYGAVGDGIADDSGAFNNAIADASASGGEVFAPSLQFYAASNIVMASNVILRGQPQATLIMPTGVELLCDGVNNVRIIGLATDTDTQPSGNDHAIHIKDSSYVYIDHCRVVNATAFGIFIDATGTNTCSQIFVEDSYVQGKGNNDVIGGGPENATGSVVKDIFISGNIVVQDTSGVGGTYANAIDIVASNNVRIINNDTQGNIVFGFEQWPKNGCIIYDNHVQPATGTSNGSIEVQTNASATDQDQYLKISRNIIDKGHIRLIGINTEKVDSCSIVDNTIKQVGNSQHGIDLFDCNNVLVADNQIYGSQTGLAGIKLQLSTYILMTGNSLVSNSIGIEDITSDYRNSSINNSFVGNGTSISGLAGIVKNNVGLNPDIFYNQTDITGATTFDRVNGNAIVSKLIGDVDITITDGQVSGDELTLEFNQGSPGGHVISSWSANVILGYGGTFTLATTTSSVDTITFIWDGTDWREKSRSSANNSIIDSSGIVLTAGSVVFAGAGGTYAQDNTNLFWDNTDNRLGIGLNNPSTQLEVLTSSGSDAVKIRTSNNSSSDAGYMTFIGRSRFGYDGTNVVISDAGATKPIIFISGGATRLTISTAGNLTLTDGGNVVFGTTTGTKIGTSTSQKLGFYNSTPIVQPTGDVLTALTNLGLVATPTISESDVTNLISDLALKAPLASPALTGTPTAPTATPATNNTQIATTAYVDAAILGQDFKIAARYATTTALPAAVYSNGSSGVGATLTAVSFGAISFDSNTPSVGDRVLVKNQASTFQNGIYTVTVVGGVATLFVLTRATDFNQSVEVNQGDSLYIVSGATLGSTTWVVNSGSAPVMGTDAITFVQTAGVGSFTAGNGIAITGASIAIDTSVTVDVATVQSLTNKDLSGVGNIFPIFNQSTTGSAATLTTSRAIYGNNFDGSTALAQIVASVYGGTGNGFTKFSGPTTSEKTFMLPDTSATILTDNAAVTVVQGGTGTSAAFTAGSVVIAGASGIYSQDNANLFWDATNHRLGIFTTSPTKPLSFGGESARTIWVERRTASNTAGNSLTINSGGATSGATNKAAGDLILGPGVSTGTGGANIRLQTSTRALSSGTGNNTPTDRVIAQSPFSVTNNSATTLFSMALASGSIVAGFIRYAVEVTDGTDYQIEEGVIAYHVTNKAGTIANNTVVKSGNQQAMTSGTLSVTFTITAANPALIQVNANSSLTPSTGYPRITCVLENLTQQAVTVS
jgi:hypothetical protein